MTDEEWNSFINEKSEWDAHPNKMQVGGSHYLEMDIQPWDVMKALLTHEEWIGYLKGNVIKYGMRQGKKDSDDANKARHYMEKLADEQQ
jgi:hypothetical protein